VSLVKVLSIANNFSLLSSLIGFSEYPMENIKKGAICRLNAKAVVSPPFLYCMTAIIYEV
jgi:hypothetical protein